MNNLISGKEALIALANGEDVQHFNKKMATFGNLVKDEEWGCCDELTISDFNSDLWAFRLKQKTITVNSIAVPKPQKNMPKKGDEVFTLDFTRYEGYVSWTCQSSINTFDRDWWKSEDEIKQVVAALRQVFGVV